MLLFNDNLLIMKQHILLSWYT